VPQGVDEAGTGAAGGEGYWVEALPAGAELARVTPTAQGDDTDDHVLARSLVVGDARVGELRVRFPRSVKPGQRDQDALSAFGDALGAALHDAATHRELRMLTARSYYDAVHDTLTNLANRTALLNRGDLALHQLEHEHPVAQHVPLGAQPRADPGGQLRDARFEIGEGVRHGLSPR
jgi:hypothetical protein